MCVYIGHTHTHTHTHIDLVLILFYRSYSICKSSLDQSLHTLNLVFHRAQFWVLFYLYLSFTPW